MKLDFQGKAIRRAVVALGLDVLGLFALGLHAFASTHPGHPRLYFTTNDLPALRAGRFHGDREVIWKNLARSADWCLTRTPRDGWIVPVSPGTAGNIVVEVSYRP